MCAGADSIDDLDVVRSGGMKTLFGGVYAPSTIGTLLREFTFGHARQLESVLREHLVALCERTDLLPGADEWVFIDIDSLLRPVYGHAKQGASYGHTKIAGKQVLRKGLSPLATTISTAGSAPVIAGMRLRAGQDRLGQGCWTHGRPSDQYRPRRRRRRADPGPRRFGLRQPRRGGSCRRAGAQFSLVMTRNAAVDRAIAAIDEDAWTPVRYPGAVRDPDTGDWISDAEVAEIDYTAFASTPDAITARLVVRRVKDARHRDALFPVWRYHPFFTNTDLPVAEADITHRQHAIIETVFADLIDGPLAHMPSGRFGANSAWVLCAAIAHNLLRAAGVLAGGTNNVARGATLRRQHRHRPRPSDPTPTTTHPAPTHPLALVESLAHTVAQHHRTQPTTTDRDTLTIRRQGPTGAHRKSWADQQIPAAHPQNQDQIQSATTQRRFIGGSRLSTADSVPVVAGSKAGRPRRQRR